VVEDCYWKHGSTRAQRYICLDHQHEVCSRCCVECCPVETPEWFSECTLAGHPTWPSASHAIPMKLVCLESSWEKRVFHNTSVKGFFESLGPLTHPPLHVAHRYVESSRHLAHYTRKPDGLLWTDANAWDAPIFYLAFHGSPGAVETVLERIDSREICEAFRDYGDYLCIIYIGSCSVLAGAAGEAFGDDLVKASGARAVIGYTTNVDWMNSLVVDMLFLYRFYRHGDPWNHLADIFDSVLKDFGPAREMGYTLLCADNDQRL
jgi:hypothetical protein